LENKLPPLGKEVISAGDISEGKMKREEEKEKCESKVRMRKINDRWKL
jgi:hypothetical protein